MTEAEILVQLVTLQKLDHALLAVEEERTQLQSRIDTEKEKIRLNKAAYEEKKKKKDEILKKRALIDIDIKSRNDEIARKDTQTAQVKTNDAFKALQQEMDNLKEDIKKFEDQVIVLMEEEEGLYKWLREQEVQMKKDEEQINADIKAVEAQIKEKEAGIAGVKQKRDEEVAKTDKSWYERYERIRKNKKLALAEVSVDAKGNGICGGCKMAVRAQAVIELKKKLAIRICENCARILYIDDTKEPAK